MSKSKIKSIPKIKSEDTKLSINDLRDNSDQSFSDVLTDLSINEFYTKADSKQKYNKFITGVVPEADWNDMSDLIELPTTSKGFKWLLVVLDLATNLFDIEPMKNKEAKTTLEAFKKIVKRGILKLPEISIKTDGGTEFKGAFDKYLSDHKILHKTSKAYRKQQMGPVEGLNTTVARILMNYLNDKSLELETEYFEWTDILPKVREEVNKYRKRDLKKLKQFQNQKYFDPTIAKETEYNIGDYVHYKVDRPIDIHGNTINDSKFRAGDRIFSIETRKIVDILYYPTAPYYRYKLHDMTNVSYSASELKPSDEKDDYYKVKKFLDIKPDDDGNNLVLVWFRGYLKKDAEWIEEAQLREDGFNDEIDKLAASLGIKKKVKVKKVAKEKSANKKTVVQSTRIKRNKYTPSITENDLYF